MNTLTPKVLARAAFEEELYPVYEDKRFGAVSVGRLVGAQDENARLLPLIRDLATLLDECRGRLEHKAQNQTCVCKLNPYVGAPVPCETCELKTFLARLAEFEKGLSK